MTAPLPRWSDLLAGGERRAAFLSYWRGMTLDDWRDLIAVAVLRRAPIDWSSSFGAASASVRGPKVYRDADAIARVNLARLRPDLDKAGREAMLMARWRCVGRTTAEFAVLDRLLVKGRVAVEGVEHLQAAKADGRGYIVVALHLGNWEALAVAGKLGFPVSSFYEPRPTRAREFISQASRRRLGVRLLAPGPAGVRPALGLLKAGEMVMIFGDEEIEGVARAPLFGRIPYAQSNLAYAVRLARRAGAPLIPAYVLRGEGARLRAVFAPPVRLGPARPDADPLKADMRLLNAAIEPIVLAHLDQWFQLHERLDEIGPATRVEP